MYEKKSKYASFSYIILFYKNKELYKKQLFKSAKPRFQWFFDKGETVSKVYNSKIQHNSWIAKMLY
jgi:hypothetical protein